MINTLNSLLVNLHNNKLFSTSVIVVIILSSLLIGAKTYDINPTYLAILDALDAAVIIFFLIEIIIRFWVWEHKLTFLKNGWNIFDTLVVSISLIPINESEFVLLARLIRIFRVLHLVSAIPELRGAHYSTASGIAVYGLCLIDDVYFVLYLCSSRDVDFCSDKS